MLKIKKAFENSTINFVFGTVKYPVSEKFFYCGTDKLNDFLYTYYKFKKKLRKRGTNVLNIYMCNLREGEGNEERWGRATYPWNKFDNQTYIHADGIQIMNPCVPVNGKTLR